MLTRRVSLIAAGAAVAAALAWTPLGAAGAAGPLYAITGARIVTGAGSPIDRGTLVMRDGVIEDVGAGLAVPAGAVTIDGTGMTVYPGLIDMSNTAAVEPIEAGGGRSPAAQAGPGRGGAAAFGRGGAPSVTRADLERERRDSILHPDVNAAEHVRYEGDQMQRLAAAGITSVLAVPPDGIFRGESALVDVLAPPDPDEVSTVGADRRGLVVVRAGVAEHITFASRGGAYPGTLLGAIAFVRQTFDDAQWQEQARAWAGRHPDLPRPALEPALDALAPALAGRMPVAFDAGSEREILRALAMAREFTLTPIIVGGVEAPAVVEDLRAQHASVVCAMNFQEGSGGRGGRGGPVPQRVAQIERDAPKVPAVLDKAGIPFAFTSEGLQNPADLIRAVARAVKEGGLSSDAALRGLTSNAARMAGVADRLGTIEKGKIANVIVTDGGLFEDGRIRHVFIDGRPVSTNVPPQATGRGGH
jgi:imidazolonepropionase-like amidohydrolase